MNYYTGMICEVFPKEIDELTRIFCLKNVSVIGISLGLERIYISMEILRLFKKPWEALHAIRQIQFLRKKDIPS